ncbi:MAG: hypothetical protein R3B13_09290 [Polyangiaceae bacterium]
MRQRALLLFALLALSCAAKKPPPPMIETQAAEVGDGDSERKESETSPNKPATASVAPPASGASNEGPKPLETVDGPSPGGIRGAPKVTLLKPGAEPRRVAKHAFRKGTKQSLKLNSVSKVSGISLPLPDIRMQAPMDIRIVEVSPEGDAKFSYAAGPFAVSQGGGGGGVLGGLLGGLGGAGKMPERVVANGWVTPQGVVREFNVEQGAQDGNAPVEVGDAFPTEPVGVGAEWQVEAVLDEKDGPVNQVSRYELLSFAGKSLKVKVSRTQEPARGGKGAPSSSEGTLTFTLGEFYPVGRSTMDSAMTVPIPGMDEASLRVRSDVNVTKR